MTFSARPDQDALMARAVPEACCTRLHLQSRPTRHCTWRRRRKTDATCLTSGSEPAAPLLRVTDRDSGRSPIGQSWRAATTLSNRSSGGRGKSCTFSAFSAEDRLHDPVHENEKSDHK